MGVVSVVEIWKGRQANRNANNVRTYKRTFLVQVSTPLDGPFVVGATGVTGIPPLFSYYLDLEGFVDLGARVIEYDVQQRSEDPLFWDVTVNYSSDLMRRSPRSAGASGKSGKAEQQNKGQADDNPLNRPTVIKVNGQRYEKAVLVDLDGSGFRNFAGQPFESTVLDDTRIVIFMEKNLAGAYGAPPNPWLSAYKDKLNTDFWWGQLPLTCKMSISYESAFENANFYLKYSFTIEVREPIALLGDGSGRSKNGDAIFLTPVTRNPVDTPVAGGNGFASDMVLPGGKSLSGWAVIKANVGNYVLDANGKRSTVIDQYGSVPKPLYLDANGKQLSPGSTPIYIVYRGYDDLPYLPLGLP